MTIPRSPGGPAHRRGAPAERLWLAGGEFAIDAQPGRGTEVTFALPITPAEAGSGSYRSA